MLCQYEPAFDPADRGLPSLRAAVSLDGRQARDLVERLTAAPVNQTSCDPPPYEDRPDIAIQIIVMSGGRDHTVYVAAAGCPDRFEASAGGIDDGTTLRTLTPERLPGITATADRPVRRQRGHRQELPGLTGPTHPSGHCKKSSSVEFSCPIGAGRAQNSPSVDFLRLRGGMDRTRVPMSRWATFSD